MKTWGDFLEVRTELILRFKMEGKSDKEILDILNLQDENHVCRIYVNCATKKQAKEAGLKVQGDLYKFNSKEEAENEANIWGEDGNGYGRNYTKL